jgi:hypothetical protein
MRVQRPTQEQLLLDEVSTGVPDAGNLGHTLIRDRGRGTMCVQRQRVGPGQ